MDHFGNESSQVIDCAAINN